MRKNLLKLLVVLGLAALAAGCKKNDPIESYTLQVTPRTLSFGAQETGVQKRIQVFTTAFGFNYLAVYSGNQKDWLNITQGDSFLDISVKSSNPGTEERRAKIEVSVVGLDPITVDITQRAEGDQTDYSITLDPTILRFAASGGELTKTSAVTTKGNGLEAWMEGEPEWYEAYVEDNKVIVTVKPNGTAAERRSEVTVTNAQGEEATLTIVQAAPQGGSGITLNPASLLFEAAGDNLSKTVTVTTEGTGTAAQVDSESQEWMTAVLDGSSLTVTVTANTLSERKGTVTISNREGGSAVLNVTQTSATDYSIVLDPASLSFEAQGTELTKTSTIITNGTALAANVSAGAEWITASVEGNTLTVTVTPQTGYESRLGSVFVTNAESDGATLTVRQAGLPAPDITGTWSWSSRCTTDGNWNNAVEASGSATITRDGSDYILTGIAGIAVKNLQVTDPRFHLDTENGAIGLTNGEAFTKGQTYYSSVGIDFPAGMIQAWDSDDTFVELGIAQVELGGTQYLQITFPDTIEGNSTFFPNDPDFWGQTGTLSYIYYDTIQMGWEERVSPVEYHRNIVLLKAL